MSEERACLNCRHWQRSKKDKAVGICGAFPREEKAPKEWRFQFENCGGWEAGDEREAEVVVSVVAGSLDGASLRKARMAAGMTQDELAEVIGCKSATISRWELDDEIASPMFLARLMDFVEMTLAGVEEMA